MRQKLLIFFGIFLLLEFYIFVANIENENKSYFYHYRKRWSWKNNDNDTSWSSSSSTGKQAYFIHRASSNSKRWSDKTVNTYFFPVEKKKDTKKMKLASFFIHLQKTKQTFFNFEEEQAHLNNSNED